MQPTSVRKLVLWLTVAAYMITYMDRVMISSAAPHIRAEFGLSLGTLGLVLGIFQWGYALFQIPGGWLGDTIGPRRALALIVTWWSAFTAATALAWNVASLATFRFLFGAGEAGAFPIATRSLSRWMLPTERAWAQGLTHAGSRMGAFITPPIVVSLISAFGWRVPFYIFGALGVVWAAIWFFWYRDTPREHSWVNAAERDMIEQNLGARGGLNQAVPWRIILRSPAVWILSAMYFCYGWGLAIYLTWYPTYLRDGRGLDLKTMGWYASLPLAGAVLGNLAGGWFSDRIGHVTGNLRAARQRIAISGFLLAAAGIVPATLAESAEVSVLITCFAVFGLEMTVSVSWAIPLDIGRDYAGSISAVMNTSGNLGGAISATVLGYIVTAAGWERPFFVAAALCVVAAVLFTKIDASRPIDFPGEPARSTPARTAQS